MIKKPTLFDSRGNTIQSQPPKKKALGLYGNIYSFPNYGKFRPRFYTLGDSSQGVDTLSRELVVRWSREMYSQLPFIPAAINALAEYSVGDTYVPEYYGENKEWWKIAKDWLMESFYPNCCVRGNDYDFQTCLNLESKLIDVDGDYLVIYGIDKGFPRFQIIQNNRIKSNNLDNQMITTGPYAGTILSDGVYYTMQGKAVAYNVANAGNLVNNMVSQTDDAVYSTKNSRLVYDAKYIDKSRGIPSIGAAILQALSIQELDQYLMEKIKIESTVALVEKTPSGEAPLELQNTLEALNQQGTEYGSFTVPPNTHAVDIVQGSSIRYIHAEGGDLQTLNSNSPANETAEYMLRLESQILSTLGVPHQLIYSTDKVGGRITSGIGEIFRSAIRRRQKIVDKRAKFCLVWALNVAMEQGLIPDNRDENIYKYIEFSHPKDFSLDAKYDADIVINNLNNGISTLNDATSKLYNKTSEETLDIQKNEQISFYKKCQEVSTTTGVDINTVIVGWRNNIKIQPQPSTPTEDTTTDTEIEQ